jgi:hypothetical protein
MRSHSLPAKTNSVSTEASARQQRLSGLMEGKHFESFIEKLSVSLVCVPVVELGAEIDRWLKEIVLGNDLDRAAITQIDPKSAKLVVAGGRSFIPKCPSFRGSSSAKTGIYSDTTFQNRMFLCHSEWRER